MVCQIHRRWDRSQPALYNLTSELIWPEVISRVRSHPQEVSWRDAKGGTALHNTCRAGSTDVVKAMLKSSSAAARIQDQAGMTPLHVACWSGNKATIRLLLEAYPQAAGTVDKRGRTPLHRACASAPTPAVETVSLLLEACPTSAHLRDHHGKTPLALLCERQQDRIKAGKDMLLMDKAGDKGGPPSSRASMSARHW